MNLLIVNNRYKNVLGKYSIILFLGLAVLYGCGNSTSPKNKKAVSDTQGPIQKTRDLEIKPKQELLDLESEFQEMLGPISLLKSTEPKIYWFIVSWLKTNYKTPDWSGYYSESWKNKAKKRGIDCSGFSRVMLDQMFNKKVAGGSQGILNHYCTPKARRDLKIGDLVFFRAPYSSNNTIVHVGVYLQDDYFVHATSTKSAALGLGLSINSLKETNWAKEFVTGARVKNN